MRGREGEARIMQRKEERKKSRKRKWKGGEKGSRKEDLCTPPN